MHLDSCPSGQLSTWPLLVAQGSTVYMSCAGGSRRTSSITTDAEPPAASAHLQGSFAHHPQPHLNPHTPPRTYV